MATAKRNLSEFDPSALPSIAGKRIGFVVSCWNDHITFNLRDGALKTLMDLGMKEADLPVFHVPGSFELIHGSKVMIEQHKVDAVVALGSVIRGETAHFDYVCQAVSNGIAHLNAFGDVPVIFGLLTDDNEQQAIDRSGGKHGNKGIECAIAALQMTGLSS